MHLALLPKANQPDLVQVIRGNYNLSINEKLKSAYFQQCYQIKHNIYNCKTIFNFCKAY